MTATTVNDEQALISSDSHVNLSHDRIKSFLASKHHDDYDSAVDAFTNRTREMMSSKVNQKWMEEQKKKQEQQQDDPMADRKHPAAGRPGHSDPVERLKDMDLDGVEAEVLYCEVSAFRYLYLLKNGSLPATRAFNDALTEFAAEDPERLIVSAQIPIHDIDAAVKEVYRVAESGGKSLQLPVFPVELGLPDYWDERYEPLFAAIQETDLPICCHIGLNTQLDDLAQRDPTPQKGIFVPMVGLSAAEAFGMWIMGGVFERFPDLKVVFVEPGVGWVSWWLYIVDDLTLRQGYDFPAISELPSHYFRQNVYLTFIDEPDAVRTARERLGIENIMWSTDYPHPVSSWPKSREIAERQMKDATPEERELILAGNARRVWNLDS